MGYYSQVEGAITIDPPLRWSEIKDSPFLPDGNQNTDIMLAVQENRTETPDGEQIIRSASTVVPRREDASKYYNLESDLQVLVKSYPDRTFAGRLVRSGEENGDMERYFVKFGRVATEKAVLTWPDGTTEPMR